LCKLGQDSIGLSIKIEGGAQEPVAKPSASVFINTSATAPVFNMDAATELFI